MTNRAELVTLVSNKGITDHIKEEAAITELWFDVSLMENHLEVRAKCLLCGKLLGLSIPLSLLEDHVRLMEPRILVDYIVSSFARVGCCELRRHRQFEAIPEQMRRFPVPTGLPKVNCPEEPVKERRPKTSGRVIRK